MSTAVNKCYEIDATNAVKTNAVNAYSDSNVTLTAGATSRSVLLVPTGTGTAKAASDEIITLTGTQTISGKTFTSPLANGNGYYSNVQGRLTAVKTSTQSISNATWTNVVWETVTNNFPANMLSANTTTFTNISGRTLQLLAMCTVRANVDTIMTAQTRFYDGANTYGYSTTANGSYQSNPIEARIILPNSIGFTVQQWYGGGARTLSANSENALTIYCLP